MLLLDLLTVDHFHGEVLQLLCQSLQLLVSFVKYGVSIGS